jgi:cytidine deaminase
MSSGAGFEQTMQTSAEMSLRDAAIRASENAYAPYSKFHVGAAMRTKKGTIFSGCNVENVAYPEGTCAEAGAIAAMAVAGEREIAEVYVVANGPKPVTPCGGCRQKLSEFAGPDVVVTMATLDGTSFQMTVAELLPGNFDMSYMEGVK